MVPKNLMNIATFLFKEYKKEYFSPTQVTNRECDLKERIRIIITEYKNCESIEVEIAKNLVLANDECESNFYKEDRTEKIKEYDEKFDIEYKKGCRVL